MESIEAACKRLLHPSVRDAAEQARQYRLLQIFLTAPFLAAVATAQVSGGFGIVTSFVTVSLVFSLGLVLPFSLIATAARKFIEPIALCLATIWTASIVAAGGGLVSPLAICAIAIVIETTWVSRSWRAFGLGFVAASAALVAAATLHQLVLPDAAPSPWHWLVPLVYTATVLARFLIPLLDSEPKPDEDSVSLEDVPNAVLLRLQPSGEVAHVSGEVEALIGVIPEMIMGSGLFDRIHLADRVGWLTALSDLRNGAKAKSLRMRIRVPAPVGMPSEALYHNFSCEIVVDGDGFTAFLRDDSERSKLEEALTLAKREVEDAALAKDQLLASVGHELRTPLNAIVGFSDLLASGMLGSFAHEKQREYVELIHAAGSHLLSVVDAVMDVSKLQSGIYGLNKEVFRLDEAVKLCVALTAGQTGAKPVELKADIAEDVGMVCCDRRAFQQVLINLLSNAVKFTPAGEVKVTVRRKGERLELTVSDTGIGMSTDDLKRVGKPFLRLENNYSRQCEGTGLGLSLVKGLVSVQGGGLNIESAPGMGTRVHVSIPVGASVGQNDKVEEGVVRREANRDFEWTDDALRKTA